MSFRRGFLVAAAFLLHASPIAAQPLADRIDSVLRDAGFNGAVYVEHGGDFVHSAAYGMANFELSVPNTTSTKFGIGSVTKQFTAMAILILQERGLLDVQDAVGRHVTNLPDAWQPITLHQLLTHTSGIMHSWALPGFSKTMAVPTTLDETLPRFFDEPLLFEPGSDFRYSGVGYFLLAKVVESVSDTEYGEFLRTEILDPLEMHDSGADNPTNVLQHRASAYQRNSAGELRNAPALFAPLLTGGGDMYSTVEDLARWSEALRVHAFLSPATYEAMYTPGIAGYSYGYGWGISDFEGRRQLEHGGSVPGLRANVTRIPAEQFTLVLLSNVTPVDLATLSDALLAITFDRSGREGP